MYLPTTLVRILLSERDTVVVGKKLQVSDVFITPVWLDASALTSSTFQRLYLIVPYWR